MSFRKPRKLKIEIRNRAKNHTDISSKHSALTAFSSLATNAALRGECRINQASADHFHHQNSLQNKNATRHESRLNALLCTWFYKSEKTIGFPNPIVASAITSKPKFFAISSQVKTVWIIYVIKDRT